MLCSVVFDFGNRGLPCVSGQLRLSLSGFVQLFGGVCCCSTEDNKIQERVGTQSIGTVDRGHSCLAASHQSRNDFLLPVSHFGDLSLEIGGNTSHIVVDCGNDRNRFFGDIHVSEDLSCFGDTWQSLVQDGGVKMVEVEIDVIILGSHTSSCEDLHGHGSTDHISRGQVKSRRSVSGHEPLTDRVSEYTSLTSAAFSHKTTSSIDASGMELHELHI